MLSSHPHEMNSPSSLSEKPRLLFGHHLVTWSKHHSVVAKKNCPTIHCPCRTAPGTCAPLLRGEVRPSHGPVPPIAMHSYLLGRCSHMTWRGRWHSPRGSLITSRGAQILALTLKCTAPHSSNPFCPSFRQKRNLLVRVQ